MLVASLLGKLQFGKHGEDPEATTRVGGIKHCVDARASLPAHRQETCSEEAPILRDAKLQALTRLAIGLLAQEVMEALRDVAGEAGLVDVKEVLLDRKSTRLNSSHALISYAVFCLKKKIQNFTLLPLL